MLVRLAPIYQVFQSKALMERCCQQADVNDECGMMSQKALLSNSSFRIPRLSFT